MTEKALVTGGAGCIGSDLCQALLARGDEVVVVDDLSSGKIEHLQPLRSSSRFSFIEGDLLNFELFEQAVRGADIVYHLAANPDVKFQPGDPTDKDLQQNTLVTYNVLEAMRRNHVKRLAFASTSAIYGICERLPISEAQAATPISLYGASKSACESLISAFQNLFEMRCWIFRFANIVGPKVRKRGRTVIGDFIVKLKQDPTRLQILGDGKQAKSYLLSSECVDAMLLAIENATQPLSVFNLGCSDSLSVDRIAEMVVAALGLKDVEFQYTGTPGGWPGDIPRFTLDVSAINRLGWKARHTSEQAVALAIESAIQSAIES